MNEELQMNKATIRSFMRAHYTDAKLIQLLDHARGGRFSFYSCCCFIGIPTADHELKGHIRQSASTGEVHAAGPHYGKAFELDGAMAAEQSAFYLSVPRGGIASNQKLLSARIIPMVLAEIRRRLRVAQPHQPIPAAKAVQQ